MVQVDEGEVEIAILFRSILTLFVCVNVVVGIDVVAIIDCLSFACHFAVVTDALASDLRWRHTHAVTHYKKKGGNQFFLGLLNTTLSTQQ